MLRPYQRRAIDDLYNWFHNNPGGHPCLVLPTGAGKSHIVAALCKEAVQEWPETRILMLTHVKELIEQNAEKLRQHWPNAPMGIYSAGLGRKQLGEPITFAGIQSIRNKAHLIGHIDLCIIDECHLVSHKDEGGYRDLLNALLKYNPNMRIIGLTATPYRLGHGLITDKPALFDDLIEPVSIEQLIYLGHLSPLRSKSTEVGYDLAGVHKRGGEYIEAELAAAVNTDLLNCKIVQEVIARAGDRKAWLFFCTGVDHARAVAEALNLYGVQANCVTGDTPKAERERIIADFRAGKLRALTNANVLTTGFDYPDIDLVAMLRPTMSPSLYVQMAGRGMRIKGHTDHCLVLDFAGVVRMHGPITAVTPPNKVGEGSGSGEAPMKACENCHELVHASVKECPACGQPFEIEEKEKPQLKLHNDDIMGETPLEMEIDNWNWAVHTSKASGKKMLKVTYYGALSDPVVTEYFTVLHDGYAGTRAAIAVREIADESGAALRQNPTLDEAAEVLTDAAPPLSIHYRKDGKFYRVLRRVW
jgi:DNA repair protein RadD